MVKITTLPDGETKTESVKYEYDYINRRTDKKIETEDETGKKQKTGEKYTYTAHDIALQSDLDGDLTNRYFHGTPPSHEQVIDFCLADENIFDYNEPEETTNVLHLLSDNLSSITAIADYDPTLATTEIVATFTYSAYGAITSQTGTVTTIYGYTSQETDPESEFMHFDARPYSPYLQVFASTDPIGFASGDVNLYRYVGNSPVNFTDPTGTDIYFAYRPIGSEDKEFMALEMALKKFLHGYIFITEGEGDQEVVIKTYSWHPFEWPSGARDANKERPPRIWNNDPRDMTPVKIPAEANLPGIGIGSSGFALPPITVQVNPYELIRVVDEPEGNSDARDALITYIKDWRSVEGVGWDYGKEVEGTEEGQPNMHAEATPEAIKFYAVGSHNCFWWAKTMLEKSGTFNRLNLKERDQIIDQINSLNGGVGTKRMLPTNDQIKSVPREAAEAVVAVPKAATRAAVGAAEQVTSSLLEQFIHLFKIPNY